MSDTDSFNDSDAGHRPSLHLLEVSDPQATPLTLAHLASRLAQPGNADAALVASGPTLAADQARALLQGVDPARVRVIAAPGGQACRALPAWHAAAKALRKSHDTQGYTLWSPGMLEQPVMRWWLGRLGRVADMQRIVITHTLGVEARRSWLNHCPEAAQLIGVTDVISASLSRRTQRRVETIPAFAPASDAAPPRPGSHTPSHTRNVLLVTDPADRVAAMHALLTVGMADEIVRQVGQRVRLIVPPRLDGLPEAMHTCRGMDPQGQGERMAVEPLAAMPWRVLKRCDAALVLSDRLTASPSPNAITCALRSGVPTVAEDSPVTQLLIDHEQTGLIAAAGKPQRLAHRLVELLSDEPLAARLGNAGKQAAEGWCGGPGEVIAPQTPG